MNVLIWFRRDLRVTDHPALAAAAGAPVLPLFIVDPAQWALPERSARQWDFVAETLGALREELRGLGAPLAVRIGDPVTVLAKLCRQHRIGRILALAPRSAVERTEDRRVADWAREAGIGWEQLAEGEAEAGALQAVSGVEPGPIPSRGCCGWRRTAARIGRPGGGLADCCCWRASLARAARATATATGRRAVSAAAHGSRRI
ncbi:deoxyribodipyrimidine photo-lyase, partial [Cereibacter changlensis]